MRQKGYSLIELMLATAATSVVMVLAGVAIIRTMRVVAQENTVMEMDATADAVLANVANELRGAILPITYADKTDKLVKILNDPDKGFGRHGRRWLSILQEGTDFIPFIVPVDFGDDGDHLDADMILELGAILPDGTHVPGGEYEVDEDGNNRLDGNIHGPLSGLNPDEYHASVSSIELDDARFERDFSFPDGAYGYGIIRFVPFRSGSGEVLILEEQDLRYDLNEDGDLQDSFAVGMLEVVYPNVRYDYGRDEYIEEGDPIVKALSPANILLQLNKDDPAWTPLFKLVQYGKKTNSLNKEEFDEANHAGNFALCVRLLMCDALGQKAPYAFDKALPAVTRQFETVVKLRNIGSGND